MKKEDIFESRNSKDVTIVPILNKYAKSYAMDLLVFILAQAVSSKTGEDEPISLSLTLNPECFTILKAILATALTGEIPQDGKLPFLEELTIKVNVFKLLKYDYDKYTQIFHPTGSPCYEIMPDGSYTFAPGVINIE